MWCSRRSRSALATGSPTPISSRSRSQAVRWVSMSGGAVTRKSRTSGYLDRRSAHRSPLSSSVTSRVRSDGVSSSVRYREPGAPELVTMRSSRFQHARRLRRRGDRGQHHRQEVGQQVPCGRTGLPPARGPGPVSPIRCRISDGSANPYRPRSSVASSSATSPPSSRKNRRPSSASSPDGASRSVYAACTPVPVRGQGRLELGARVESHPARAHIENVRRRTQRVGLTLMHDLKTVLDHPQKPVGVVQVVVHGGLDDPRIAKRGQGGEGGGGPAATRVRRRRSPGAPA